MIKFKKNFAYYWVSLKVIVSKLIYPAAGYYERICLVNGITKEEIDEWVEDAISKGYITSTNRDGREDVCATEISYWEG